LLSNHSILITGNTFALSQTINLNTDLPFGINQAYLTAVNPAAVLRTWASGSATIPATHNLDLLIQVGTASGGSDPANNQVLSGTFSTVPPLDSDDYEFSVAVQSLAAFDYLV
jgi:hypothetical protein